MKKIIFVLALVLLASPLLWRTGMVRWAAQHTYPTVTAAPADRVAIVFGARVHRSGRLSAMLHDRVETAVDLYHAGKVDVLLMSGDGRTEFYNEPESMAAYAIRRGVPTAAIALDPHGLRTYDTCYRANHVYGLETAVLVTQEFHLPRAVVTCRSLGIDAAGLIADRRRYSERSMRWSTTREFLASQLALVDIVRREPAAVVGEPTPIPAVSND